MCNDNGKEIGYLNQEQILYDKFDDKYVLKEGFKVEILNEYDDITVEGHLVYLVKLIDENKGNYFDKISGLSQSLQLISSFKISAEEIKSYNFRLYKDDILIKSWNEDLNIAVVDVSDYMVDYMKKYQKVETHILVDNVSLTCKKYNTLGYDDRYKLKYEEIIGEKII